VFPVATLADGHLLAITTLVLHGDKPGPTVGVSATVHGDEFEGLLILRELWRTMQRRDLAGTLWLLPVVNPPAFAALTRNTPVDLLDLNRNFPGSPDGWLSEQLAWTVTREFLERLDFYVDIHAGGTFPWVDYCYVLNDEAFSRAFLSQLLYRPAQLYTGTTAGVTVGRGKPTCVVEIGGGYQDQAVHTQNGVRGVRNMLRHAGALPGPATGRPDQLLLHTLKVMRPRQGGLLIPEGPLPPGTRLDGPAPLAEIVSPYTLEPLETMVAPFQRNIVVLSRNYVSRVHPGDYAFMIGDGATATAY
jgi:predicted deacylase